MLIASSCDDEKNNRKRKNRAEQGDCRKKIAICGGQKTTVARRFICHDVTAVTSGMCVCAASGVLQPPPPPKIFPHTKNFAVVYGNKRCVKLLLLLGATAETGS